MAVNLSLALIAPPVPARMTARGSFQIGDQAVDCIAATVEGSVSCDTDYLVGCDLLTGGGPTEFGDHLARPGLALPDRGGHSSALKSAWSSCRPQHHHQPSHSPVMRIPWLKPAPVPSADEIPLSRDVHANPLSLALCTSGPFLHASLMLLATVERPPLT
jgi:hypothetical protein